MDGESMNEHEDIKSKKHRKAVIIVLLILLFVLVLLPFGISIFIYEQYFGIRYETTASMQLYLEDFEGLERERYEFVSDKGQKLVGYLYSKENVEYRGIVIMAHGFGGGGHNSYMDCANYFAQSGYYVFAYDATGNDESEGEGVGGLPQGVIDLEHAISFVRECAEIPDLPIVLFGHSWGGYSVANVLTYHPQVKAIVSMSGFNQSSDLIRSQGEAIVGGLIHALMPYVNCYERVKFGEYAKNTAMDGFAGSEASVMVLHSSDDNVVPQKYGYDVYYARYKDDARFAFVHFEDKGHNEIYYSAEGRAYMVQINEEFAEWRNRLTYDYMDVSNEERFIKDKAAWLEEHLERARWCNLIDTELFAKMVAFYDESLGE